jgi:hypothetical protein
MKDNNAEMALLEKRQQGLENQRQGLEKRLSAVSEKISKLVEIKFLPEYTKRYADTYWVKANGYGKEDTWPVYTHVRAVKRLWDTGGNGINCALVCDNFQCTNNNEIIINLGREEYFFYLGKRITKSAYEKAKQALLDKIRSVF